MKIHLTETQINYIFGKALLKEGLKVGSPEWDKAWEYYEKMPEPDFETDEMFNDGIIRDGNKNKEDISQFAKAYAHSPNDHLFMRVKSNTWNSLLGKEGESDKIPNENVYARQLAVDRGLA